MNGIAKYLENHGIHKIVRQNGKNPLFDAALIRRIIQNPVYSGKISYGRRRTEKIHFLSGILKCPVCGAGMYGNKAIKKRKDGSNYNYLIILFVKPFKTT